MSNPSDRIEVSIVQFHHRTAQTMVRIDMEAIRGTEGSLLELLEAAIVRARAAVIGAAASRGEADQ